MPPEPLRKAEPSAAAGVQPADGPMLAAQLRPSLVHYFRRKTGNEEEANDLAQDVLLRVLAHAAWESMDQAKGYVFRAAVNRWHDRCRRLRTQGATLAWDEAVQHPDREECAPEDVFSRRQELLRLAGALDELNARTRTILVLVKLEKMRIATVADAMGISVSAVNKHLARGLAHLSRLRAMQEERA